jgi:hypothetical protein
LHGALSHFTGGYQPIDRAVRDPTVGINHDNYIGRVLTEVTKAASQRISLSFLVGFIANQNVSTRHCRNARRIVGAIVCHYEEAIGCPELSTYVGKGRQQSSAFIVCRYEHCAAWATIAARRHHPVALRQHKTGDYLYQKNGYWNGEHNGHNGQ